MSDPAPLDSLDFAEAVHGLPEQLDAAARRAAATELPRVEGDVTQVVVLGMGGSGIAGDVLAAAARHDLEVPVTVLKQYRVPRHVGPGTLVFAVSYSGDTEETVSMATGAVERGAHLVAVSTGGALGELAAACGGAHVPCPPGLMPRAALGSLVAPLLVCLGRLGLLEGADGWLRSATEQLARRRDRCATGVDGTANGARELARRIGRTIPVVYGGGTIGEVAAMRWKADVNENAKAPAFWNAYPELDHNEICGWGQHGDVTRQVFTLVEVRHHFEHPKVSRRFEVTREIVEETTAGVLSVEAEGDGRLAQLLDLMYVGDWTSLYMAYDAGVDPGPVDAIARLKEELAG